MKIFIFDTETTGTEDKDEVIQLGGFLLDENLNLLEVVNSYCHTNVFVSDGALAKHGIDNRLLYELSKGKTLEDHIYDIDFLREPKDIIFIAYNTKFDIKKVNYTLMQNGVVPIDFGRKIESFNDAKAGSNYNLCLMETFKKIFGYKYNQKLEILARDKLSKYTQQNIEKAFDHIYNKVNVNGDMYLQSRYHNALFDSFICWLLLSEYRAFYYC